MQAPIPPTTPWFELRETRIDFDSTPGKLRFAVLQRGGVRGGVWFVQGRPVLFVPSAQA